MGSRREHPTNVPHLRHLREYVDQQKAQQARECTFRPALNPVTQAIAQPAPLHELVNNHRGQRIRELARAKAKCVCVVFCSSPLQIWFVDIPSAIDLNHIDPHELMSRTISTGMTYLPILGTARSSHQCLSCCTDSQLSAGSPYCHFKD